MDKKKKSTKPSSATNRPDSKKSKSPKKKTKKTTEAFMSKYPPIDYEKIKEIPDVTIAIRLDQGQSNFMYDVKFPINTSIRKVKERINEKHGNACHNIKLYVIENSNKQYIDALSSSTLKDLGINPNETLTLHYEFEPSIHPLLEAGLI